MDVESSSSSARAFIRALYGGNERIALLAVGRITPNVHQRIGPAGRVLAGRFQAWLRHLNAGGHDIFIGMNPMRAATNRRKKADVSEVRRLQLDLVTGEELLAMYRQRGTAEGHMGELMSVVNPALSSSPRPKRHYRGRPVENPGSGIDAFACNETRLLLAVFGYQMMHAQRAVLERATGTGWSLRLLLERVLRAPARIRRAAVASVCPEPGYAGPIGGSKPENLAERRLGAPFLGSGDPVFRPGEPDRPESSPAVGLGE